MEGVMPEPQVEQKPQPGERTKEAAKRLVEAARASGTIKAEQKPPEAKPPEEKKDAPRGDDGKFQKQDPNYAAMRELLKSMKSDNDTLKAEVALLRESTAKAPGKDPEAEERARKREAVLATMPPETRKWWENSGAELARVEAEEIANQRLRPHERALKRMDEQIKKEDEDARWNADFNRFRTEMLVDGVVIDERAMLTMLNDFEQKGYRFGADNQQHFRNVYTLLQKKDPGAAVPVRTGDEAAAAAAKEAAEKAAAAGVAPRAAPTPRPQAEREEELKRLRETGWNAPDATKAHWRTRLKGLGILPSERSGVENGG
jgi:hypothetical protein